MLCLASLLLRMSGCCGKESAAANGWMDRRGWRPDMAGYDRIHGIAGEPVPGRLEGHLSELDWTGNDPIPTVDGGSVAADSRLDRRRRGLDTAGSGWIRNDVEEFVR